MIADATPAPGTLSQPEETSHLGKPNYSFQKRQKELARQAKKEEKKLRKLNKANAPDDVEPELTIEPEPTD
jgi:hypothetical protein